MSLLHTNKLDSLVKEFSGNRNKLAKMGESELWKKVKELHNKLEDKDDLVEQVINRLKRLL